MMSRNYLSKIIYLIIFFIFSTLLLFVLERKLNNSNEGNVFAKASYKKIFMNENEADDALQLFSTEDDRNNLIIVYNRIPKTGSTSFINVAYDLCKKNSFNVIHLNVTKNSHTMSLADQARFVNNVTHWMARKPVLYHGHIGYIDFTKFGSYHPIYINILRDPLDRLVSYYYFLRYGDDYRPHLVRSRHGNKLTFDECVAKKEPDCHPNHMWLQIPFLCGQSAACWIPGNKWALEEAKRNLINHYLLVGITEELKTFISILESVIPSFFRDATNHFLSSHKNHLRKTNKKIQPSHATQAEIRKSLIWKMENELYEFAYQQFQYYKNQMDVSINGTLQDKGINFRFEKIYPKS